MIRYLIFIVAALAVTFCGQAQIVNLGTAYLSDSTAFSAVSNFDNRPEAEFYNDGRAYYYADFNNDGIYDYYNPTGTAVFRGHDFQKLTGLDTSYFYKVVFNNTAQVMPFLLKGVFHIDKTARFLQGVINNRQYGGQMIFGMQASAENASNISYIDGPVKKVGHSPFVYPVGNQGYYRPAGTATGNLNRLFEATYFLAPSNQQYPHQQKVPSLDKIDNREYWTLQSPQPEGDTYGLSLSYSLQTTPPEYIEAAEEGTLVVAHWNPEKQLWVNDHGNVSTADKTITTAVDYEGLFTLAISKTTVKNCKIKVFNLVDATGATRNGYMRLKSKCAEILKVAVFNRWGRKVFQSTHYGPQGEVFDGFSSGSLTINRQKGLPTGTYYYVITYQNNKSAHPQKQQQVGYVYIIKK